MAARDPETGRYLTGNSGGGRPKGSRNKLGEQFLEALTQDFTEHGQQAIVACREEMVASTSTVPASSPARRLAP